MSNFFKIFFLLFTVFTIGLAGCSKDNLNKVPVSIPGPHMEIVLPVNSITVTGSGTDADGTISSYLWSQVSGPDFSTIQDPGAASTKIQFTHSGNYIFQLMVVDNDGATGTDTVSVLVNPSKIDSVILGANATDGYFDLTIAGNGSNLDYTDPNSPEIDAASWTFNGNDILRGAFFFNLGKLPSNITIQSAKLSLYSNPTPLNGNLVDANFGANNAIYIERIITNWNMTSGWANQPVTTATNNILIPHTNLPRLDLIDIDVTSLVNDMLSNTNYGFGLRLQNEAQYTSRLFCGIRYADASKHPQLKITYQIK